MATERTAGAGGVIDLRQFTAPTDGLITAVAAGGVAGTVTCAAIWQQPGATVVVAGMRDKLTQIIRIIIASRYCPVPSIRVHTIDKLFLLHFSDAAPVEAPVRVGNGIYMGIINGSRTVVPRIKVPSVKCLF